MILEGVSVGPVETNCYILASAPQSNAIIIDPGADENKIRKVLGKHRLKPAFIINTHGHFDHIGCDDKFGVPILIHRDDLKLLKDPKLNFSSFFAVSYRVENEIKILGDNETIELDGIILQVIHTPGHTPGSISLLMKGPEKKILFSGDTLFCQGVGRTDLPGADESALIKSIKERLFVLDQDTVIYPGHGPASTIKEEKSNSFY